ncbi:modification methylase [Desulfonema ishimotonii]|uniref:site-specific DNA-methyltransferase (cytosine-N(4)-specific) n=1 Tax=Desulfonema ishimotonii TaxID=45657 RepID=A0A401G132_9BACT|nr:site-specific DNA-methyltransferase [Desulfonema ishimotonii]GBC62932.1 modification methylase [Desulfonema ishimotonii]
MMITDEARKKLFKKYEKLIAVNPDLNRRLVSFQANKQVPLYRWFKYKEGFSSKLVRYFMTKYHPTAGHILDPFAGAGTTLFSAINPEKDLFSTDCPSWSSTGIELMPVGKFAIEARLAAERIDRKRFHQQMEVFGRSFDEFRDTSSRIKHIAITQNAFTGKTEENLNRYLNYFGEAISAKLRQIAGDLRGDNRNESGHDGKLTVISGSSLEALPKLADGSFDFIMTSPPYCNRYDYTRTYALELVFLGHDDADVKRLRQELLSCTVENKEKDHKLKEIYNKIGRRSDYDHVMSVYMACEAMQEVNSILGELNAHKKLNNSNIPRMVRNYFLEMCFCIFEMARILKNNGFVVMVNDNVRYGGEEIPVDLILSSFAESFGLRLKKIWILATGKGNSSQQMGNHGKSELRKCIYVWEKI